MKVPVIERICWCDFRGWVSRFGHGPLRSPRSTRWLGNLDWAREEGRGAARGHREGFCGGGVGGLLRGGFAVEGSPRGDWRGRGSRVPRKVLARLETGACGANSAPRRTKSTLQLPFSRLMPKSPLHQPNTKRRFTMSYGGWWLQTGGNSTSAEWVVASSCDHGGRDLGVRFAPRLRFEHNAPARPYRPSPSACLAAATSARAPRGRASGRP